MGIRCHFHNTRSSLSPDAQPRTPQPPLLASETQSLGRRLPASHLPEPARWTASDPAPVRHRVVAQRRFPGRASVARRPRHSPARPCCSSLPCLPRRVASEGARSCSVYTRVSREAPRPARQPPQRRWTLPAGTSNRRPIPPGGPEIGDGRHCSRSRAEGCGAARSRTPAPAAEVTAPRVTGWGRPIELLALAGEVRGRGEAWAPSRRDAGRGLTPSRGPALPPSPLRQLPSPQPTVSRRGGWSGVRGRGVPTLAVLSEALDRGCSIGKSEKRRLFVGLFSKLRETGNNRFQKSPVAQSR